mmetsp:Transcript_31702/g.93306  ORF Transcript_31702/g.93306 Transcript_31702/m.93306 type:complete len:250 (-) Transcript_31702:250-999(-)
MCHAEMHARLERTEDGGDARRTPTQAKSPCVHSNHCGTPPRQGTGAPGATSAWLHSATSNSASAPAVWRADAAAGEEEAAPSWPSPPARVAARLVAGRAEESWSISRNRFRSATSLADATARVIARKHCERSSRFAAATDRLPISFCAACKPRLSLRSVASSAASPSLSAAAPPPAALPSEASARACRSSSSAAPKAASHRLDACRASAASALAASTASAAAAAAAFAASTSADASALAASASRATPSE